MTDDIKNIKIIKIKRTCESCPAQWEFKTDDNRTGYIRYRSAAFRICLSLPDGDLSDAINRRPIMEAFFGEAYEGSLSNERMLHALELVGFNLGDSITIFI